MFAVFSIPNAGAQDVETLVMPGEVIADHADIEPECSSCHKVFNKGAQRDLCMDCHETIATDIEAAAGFHGKHPDAKAEQCSECHTEHEGRDANVVILDATGFDHSFTNFELVGKHLEADCDGCHQPSAKHRDAVTECVACHEDETPHQQTMGDDCATCHQPTAWSDAEFDHETTGYPLLGKHQQAACLDCHADRTFLNAETTCFGCHSEDDAHDGRSGQECGNCHNPSDWHDSSFDHGRDTDFLLQDSHGLLNCGDCHSERPFEDELSMECVACHVEDDTHDTHNGEQCDTCHASTKWTEPFFNHDTDTDYRLLGGHREVVCEGCHLEPIFEVELNSSCDSCHLSDDVHDGALGARCDQCHTEINWQDPVFFDHGLTGFPLLGEHSQNECEDCHSSQRFTDVEASCVSCHAEDDSHEGRFAEDCDACHNPVAWDLWTFDHDIQTEFPLQGAHADVRCESCHRGSLANMQMINGSCGSCHRSDDIHDGEFGPDCGRCHSPATFTEVRTLQ